MELYRPKNLNFGDLLRYERLRQNISQEDLAKKVGRHFTYISKMEIGTAPAPAADTIVDIARALELDPDELLIAAHKAPPDILERLKNDITFVKDIRKMFEMKGVK